MNTTTESRFGITDEQVARLRAANTEKEAAEADIAKTFEENYGIKRGDEVKDKANGLHYIVEKPHFNVRSGHISILGRRIWKTGIKAGRTAMSSSFLGPYDLEVVRKAGDMGE